MDGQLGPDTWEGAPTCLLGASKPYIWPYVSGLAASITTSKVAASLPQQASSAATSPAWSCHTSSLSILAGGGNSACMVGALPQALELAASPLLATWSLEPTAPNPGTTGMVAHSTSTYSGTKSPVEELSPTSTSSSASSSSSSIGSTTGLHSSYTCIPSQPKDKVWVHSSSWSALVMQSQGTTSSIYQCLPCPPQFGHLQFGTPSRHSSNLEVAG